MIRKFLSKIFRFFIKKRKPELKRELFNLSIVNEFPVNIDNNIVYVEGNLEDGDFWYALLKCPCGCREEITLNLLGDTSPCWDINIEGSDFSIYPSVWRSINCKSHFWIRNRQVIWV